MKKQSISMLLIMAGMLFLTGCQRGEIVCPDRSGTEIVAVENDQFPTIAAYVRCRNEAKRPADDLSAGDFKITEGGQAINATRVTVAKHTVSRPRIVFVLDNVVGNEKGAVVSALAKFIETPVLTDRVAAVAMTEERSGKTGPYAEVIHGWGGQGHVVQAAEGCSGVFLRRKMGDAIAAGINLAGQLPKADRQSVAVVVLASRDWSGNAKQINAALKRYPVDVFVVSVPVGGKFRSLKRDGTLSELAEATGALVLSQMRISACREKILARMEALYRLEFGSKFRKVGGGKVNLAVSTKYGQSEQEYNVSSEVVQTLVGGKILPPLKKIHESLAPKAEALAASEKLAANGMKDAISALGRADGDVAKKHLSLVLKTCNDFTSRCGVVSDYKYPAEIATQVENSRGIPAVNQLDRRIAGMIEAVKKCAGGVRGIQLQLPGMNKFADAVVALQSPSQFNMGNTWRDFVDYVKSDLPKSKSQVLYDLAWKCRSAAVAGLVATKSYTPAAKVLTDFTGVLQGRQGYSLTADPFLARARVYRLGGAKEKAFDDYLAAMKMAPNSSKLAGEYVTAVLAFEKGETAIIEAGKVLSQWRALQGGGAQATSITFGQAVTLLRAAVKTKTLSALSVARACATCTRKKPADTKEKNSADHAVSFFEQVQLKDLTRTDRVLYAKCLEEAGEAGDDKKRGEQMKGLLTQYGQWATKWPTSPESNEVAETLKYLGYGYYLLGKKAQAAFIFQSIQRNCPGFPISDRYKR